MLDRKVEDKKVAWLLEDNVGHNSAIGAADCLPLVQQIAPIDAALGDTGTQRIGDRIKPKRLRVNGVVSLDPVNQTSTSNILVRILILAQKDIKVGSAVTAGNVDVAHLLKPSFNTAPGSDQIAYSGVSHNIFDPVNTDKFRVYMDKTITLCPATNATVENTRQMKKWSYTFKELPAAFTYDAGNGDWVNNFAAFCAIGYAYADGTAADVILRKVVSTYSAALTYEDA